MQSRRLEKELDSFLRYIVANVIIICSILKVIFSMFIKLNLFLPTFLCPHQDDKDRTEAEMAQRRAALLEKQQKRAEEIKQRRLEQEKEKESK